MHFDRIVTKMIFNPTTTLPESCTTKSVQMLSLVQYCSLPLLTFNVQAAILYWIVSALIPTERSKGKENLQRNVDAYDEYIRFKSDWEASGQFISDQSLLSERDQNSMLKKHWPNRMALQRRSGVS